MKSLELLGSFKKDLRRIENRRLDRFKLDNVVTALRRGETLPASARPHKLSGEWFGFWECHIAPDWLLIYDVTDTAILLARTGTHADLFE